MTADRTAADRAAARPAPRLSIGVPVYNGGAMLVQALESVVDQSFRDFEVIISDNGSTDGTEALCRALAERDPRVRYVRQSPPIDAYDNFNFVLAEARAPLFMWAAHDDWREPQYLERLVDALDRNPSAVLAFSAFDNVTEEGVHFRGFRPMDWGELFSRPKVEQLEAMFLLDGAATQQGNFVYGVIRTDVLRRCGGNRRGPVRRCGEDVHLLIRLLSEGDFAFVPELLFHYRIKRPPKRPRGPLLPYLLRRAFGRTPGHGGNLLMVLHAYHAEHAIKRRMVRRQPLFSPRQKMALCARLAWMEAVALLGDVPAAVLRDLTRGRLGTRLPPAAAPG